MSWDQYLPPGHAFMYEVSFEETDDGRPSPPGFFLTVPSSRPHEDVSTLRVSRMGGDDPADELFRARLHRHVGAVTVAAGHVETAMKRLLIQLRDPTDTFADVDYTWTDLEKKLRSQAAGQPDDPRCKRLLRILDWASDNRVKWRRDNVVHAYWWNYDGVGVFRSRFRRRDDGEQIIGTWQGLEEDSALLFRYAALLDDVLGEDWGRALLPPIGEA
jgi:hypothetical protein